MNTAPQSGGLARVLGRFDLTLFLIAALVNLNSVPVVAGMGPGALGFWAVGFILFFLPALGAVLELSTRHPEEGGIYLWSRIAFGDFQGFLSGWCYWINNIFYVPTLLMYIVGFGTFMGGDLTRALDQNPAFMLPTALGLLWIITWLNILGLGVSKYIQNAGAAGTFVTAMTILAVGVTALSVRGMSNPISVESIASPLGDWQTLALISVVCLNFTGIELGSVMGDELKDPRRNIPRAAVIAGLSTVFLYLVTTFALQAAIPAGEIGVIDGVLQGVENVAREIRVEWVIIPVAMLMTLNAAGNTTAWLAGSSRIPFVIGIDRFLPPVLGRIHPRHRTPFVALIVQGIASSVFLVVYSLGVSVTETYMILLNTTIVLQLIPYLYMFGALFVLPRRPGGQKGFFGSRVLLSACAVIGGVMTAIGIALSFVPPEDVSGFWSFEAKMALGTVGLIAPGLLFYRHYRSRIPERLP